MGSLFFAETGFWTAAIYLAGEHSGAVSGVMNTAGILGGIGFTMSIFITNLAFAGDESVNASKMAILLASLTAGITGFLWLKFLGNRSGDA